jgi:hypothetical protein
MTTDGPTIQLGKTYLITFRTNRVSETDLNTLVSVSVGAGGLTDLQSDPANIKESSPLMWPNPKHLDNSDSGASNYFLISGSGCAFDLFSIDLYDYPVKGVNLQHAANQDWPEIQKNIFT